METLNQLSYHDFCLLFPPAEDSVMQGLIQDIKANGLLEPILLYEGKILDGRTRYEACNAAGVVPTFQHFNGDKNEAYVYVVSRNLHRRHLTNIQRAFIAAKLNLPTQYERAQEARVSKQVQSHVEKIISDFPDFRQAVHDGVLSPQSVLPLAKNPEKRKRAKELLDSNQIKKLYSLLQGKGYSSYAAYRGTRLQIRKHRKIVSYDKVTALLQEAEKFCHRFHEIRAFLEELCGQVREMHERNMLASVVSEVGQMLPVYKKQIHELYSKIHPDVAKDCLIGFWDNVFDDLKYQVASQIKRQVPKLTANQQAVQDDVLRMFKDYEDVLDEILSCVSRLSDIPQNEVEAFDRYLTPPDDLRDGVMIQQHLYNDVNENLLNTSHSDRLYQFAEQARLLSEEE